MVEEALQLVVKTLLLGPFVYVGMLLAVEPERSLKWLTGAMTMMLLLFERQWGRSQFLPGEVVVTPRVLWAVRVAGMALAVHAISLIIGLAA